MNEKENLQTQIVNLRNRVEKTISLPSKDESSPLKIGEGNINNGEIIKSKEIKSEESKNIFSKLKFSFSNFNFRKLIYIAPVIVIFSLCIILKPSFCKKEVIIKDEKGSKKKIEKINMVKIFLITLVGTIIIDFGLYIYLKNK